MSCQHTRSPHVNLSIYTVLCQGSLQSYMPPGRTEGAAGEDPHTGSHLLSVLQPSPVKQGRTQKMNEW